MEIEIKLDDIHGNNLNVKVNKIEFQKMLFLYNALNEGWTVKKKNETYVFIKNHEDKKEIFLESYLSKFISENFDINKILLQ